MAFKIITADQRLQQPPKINVLLLGPAGVGKTTNAKTLNPADTLFIDLEAGTLALEGWGADIIPCRTWDEMTMIASILHGPNPAMRPEQKYSQAYYDHACSQAGADFVAYVKSKRNVYVDSITVAGRLSLQWAKGQPEAISEKTGKPDIRGAYGLIGTELIQWITHLQHVPDQSMIIVGGLEEKTDEFGRKSWLPMIEGSKAGKEIPYIFDEVITMQNFKNEDGTMYRAFVCHQQNPYGYPAKDRSGRLDMIEEPNIGKMMDKIRNGARRDDVNTALPTVLAA